MTAILGISAFYHDSAAALIVDGTVIAAAQEERFSRIKHDASFPTHAIEYCLQSAGLNPEDIDLVGFYEKPFLKFERLIESYLATTPFAWNSFFQAMPAWLNERLWTSRHLHQGLDRKFKNRFIWAEHHESHAASAFFPSPFESAAIMTFDGVGEWATSTMGIGNGNQIELLDEIRFPHSLGLLYSAITYFTGFTVNSGEYKLMGLAPFGEPKYFDLMLDELIDLKPDGSFRLNLDYFDYLTGLRMTSEKMEKLFERPRRKPEDSISESDCHLAASIQKVTEEILVRCGRKLYESTGQHNLCLAGGVALNCVANSKLLEKSGFEDIWIQPAAGDAGGALGVAWLIWNQLLGHPRMCSESDLQNGSQLGPRFTNESVEQLLSEHGVSYSKPANPTTLCERVAGFLDEGRTIAWFQGRMEYGPRALGNRSILGDPRRPEMQARINQEIKFREAFRPFAPAVLEEQSSEYFHVPKGKSSPYMLLVAQVSDDHRIECDSKSIGLERVHDVNSTIPSVTHVDGSARVQTVAADSNPRFHQLLESFYRQTGCPVLINTSFNIRDEPIVCTPKDALNCFFGTGLDILVLEDCLVFRHDNPEFRPLVTATKADELQERSSLPITFVGINILLAVLYHRAFGLGLGSTAIWGIVVGLCLTAYFLSSSFKQKTIEASQRISNRIGWMATRIILTFIYGLIIIPIGWIMHLIGYDPLQQKANHSQQTYWIKRSKKETKEDRYFKQY